MGNEFKIPTYPSKNHAYYGNKCSNNNKLKQFIKQPCEICGKIDGVEKHHEDYNDPFSIRWLCKRHHLDLHRIIRAIKKNSCLELF